MKKVSYILELLLFTLFIPRVYALTFDIGTEVVKQTGNSYKVKVTLKDIAGTNEGIFTCSMKINMDNSVKLNSKVSSLGKWSMTVGDVYLFDGDPIIKNTEIFEIPVKLSGDGEVSLENIECSDGNVMANISNKSVNLKYDSNNFNDTDIIKDSNCNLADIEISDLGNDDIDLDFNPDVLEYEIVVSNYEELLIEPILASGTSSFDMIKNEDNITITVNAEDGSTKTYTLYVSEGPNRGQVVTDNNTNNKYTPIFIGIIVILVIINIVRIIVSRKRNKG